MSRNVITRILRGISIFALSLLFLLVLSNLVLAHVYHIPLMGDTIKTVAGLFSGSLLLTVSYEVDTRQEKSPQ
ncbi:hypothetical protein [uncultured Streptococcus sp.]|uniref:hypothetical protein n=1 Tax=uncultured Streptococcus sp. TaxID=83427 RepID=UPI0028D43C11|nr:hypothetical protein [uncultured Streptococcus sp.]